METNISNKCKAYTSLEQSKILAEILPIESANFSWTNIFTDKWQAINETPKEVEETVLSAIHTMRIYWKIIPCWSVTALLEVLPSSTLDSSDDHHYRLHCMERFTEWYDNAIDACYEMILKLHEQKLL